eukprot:IDg9269t1
MVAIVSQRAVLVVFGAPMQLVREQNWNYWAKGRTGRRQSSTIGQPSVLRLFFCARAPPRTGDLELGGTQPDRRSTAELAAHSMREGGMTTESESWGSRELARTGVH